MSVNWCANCGGSHAAGRICTEEVPATGPERHGWRVNVETPRGIEAYGVMVAASHDEWRARILTYPNVLWTVPGGGATMKFLDATPQAVEQQAANFIRHFCEARGYVMRDGLQPVEIGEIGNHGSESKTPAAERKVRFLPVRFGVVRPIELGGTGNLSEGGIFVITEMPNDSGSWVNLRLETDVATFGMRGQVRWMCRRHHVGRSPGMGIQITKPPPPYVHYVRGLA